jgi:hypothetical protein
LHDNVKDARSNDDDGDNEGDHDKEILEDPMATEEDKPESTRYNLRPNWERTYDERFACPTVWTILPAQKAMTYSSYSKEQA